MANRRSPPANAQHCPLCDGRLEGVLDGPPRDPLSCPSCAVELVTAEAASATRRTLATLVDAALLLVTAGPLSWLMLRALDVPTLLEGAVGIDILLQLLEQPLGLLAVRLIPFVTMATLYGLLFWWLSGQTPGQRLVGLRVIDDRGAQLSLPRAAVRAVASLAGALLGFAGWLWTAFDRERRAWHDHLARTHVIRTP